MPKHLRNWLIEFVISFDKKMLKHYIDTTPTSYQLKCKYPKIKYIYIYLKIVSIESYNPIT